MPKIEQPIFVGEAATLDLDSLFDEQRDRFQVPGLFDALISRLEEIIAADVIEHRTVQEAIQRLKAVLARNRRGSLASILLTMNYGRFVMNAFGGVLSANKYTKPIVESFTQEFQAANAAVDQATEATKREAIRRLTNPKRLEMFIEEQPEARAAIAGYLPEPSPTADNN